ncbi:MAG: pilus assembly protein PilM [Chloroflexota bacterium]
MARKLSLYVENTDLKLLLSNGKEVEKWASIPLAPGLVSSGVIINEAEVGQLLRERLRTLKINARRVILGLSGLNSLYRIISMPELPKTMVAEAVKNEAERVLPVAMNDVYLSYQPIMKVGDERRYFLAAFPRNATDALVRIARGAGLDPYLMDLGPLAFCRSVALPRAVVVNVQGTVLDLAVMVDRVPQVIRSLQLSSETESLTNRLAIIAEEIERTIAFYNTSAPDQPMDPAVPILVCGDLARAPDSWSPLQSQLNHSISVLPPPMHAPSGFDAFKFTVNMGLNLKETARGKNALEYSLVNFDALPEVYRPKHISPINVVAPVAITVSLAIIILLTYLTQNTRAQIGTLRDEATATQNLARVEQNEINELKSNITKLEESFKPVDMKTAALTDRLNALRDNRIRVQMNTGEMVYHLIQTTPPIETSLELGQISYAGESISISGSSASTEDVFSYVRTLKNSQRFSAVTIVSLSLSGGAGYEYELSLSEK